MLGITGEPTGRLLRELVTQIGQRFRHKEIPQHRLGLLHEEVDSAGSGDAPGRRFAAEERTMSSDLAALEEGALRIDGFENVPDGNRLRWSS